MAKPKTVKPFAFEGPYDPAAAEKGLYAAWSDNRLFEPDATKPLYACVMAPPNLTAALHLGHALELSLADAHLRALRMLGENVAWAPGYDHAGIATQVKFEKSLAPSEAAAYAQMPRDEKVAKINAWAIANGERIVAQMRRLGVSAD